MKEQVVILERIPKYFEYVEELLFERYNSIPKHFDFNDYFKIRGSLLHAYEQITFAHFISNKFEIVKKRRAYNGVKKHHFYI